MKGSLGPMPIRLPVLNLCNVPPLLPTLKGPLIKDPFMQPENLEMILGIGVLNGITDGTTVLTARPMTGHGLLTTDVIHLIIVTRTTVVSMITRVLSVLRLLSTDKLTIMLPGIMMSGVRITNNPLRMVAMTDGCHHPPLLL